MESRFNVIFRGELTPSSEIEQVKRNIAALYKVPTTKIESWFTGRHITVKKNLDLSTANKYKNVLEKAGAICYLEEISGVSKIQSSQNNTIALRSETQQPIPERQNQLMHISKQPNVDNVNRQETIASVSSNKKKRTKLYLLTLISTIIV